MAIMSEAEVQKSVMRGLIAISDNYWGSFLEYKPDNLVSEYVKRSIDINVSIHLLLSPQLTVPIFVTYIQPSLSRWTCFDSN